MNKIWYKILQQNLTTQFKNNISNKVSLINEKYSCHRWSGLYWKSYN
jgi:hypothetical protein